MRFRVTHKRTLNKTRQKPDTLRRAIRVLQQKKSVLKAKAHGVWLLLKKTTASNRRRGGNPPCYESRSDPSLTRQIRVIARCRSNCFNAESNYFDSANFSAKRPGEPMML